MIARTLPLVVSLLERPFPGTSDARFRPRQADRRVGACHMCHNLPLGLGDSQKGLFGELCYPKSASCLTVLPDRGTSPAGRPGP